MRLTREALCHRGIVFWCGWQSWRLLGLHHIAGAFFQQGLNIDAVDHIQWVEHIAFGLGHFLALLVADQAGDIDGFKWYFGFAIFIFDQVHAHHHHARYPEENNIKTSDQHIGGVEGFEAFGMLWPALGGKGPQCGGEPGIQYIFVLVQLGIIPGCTCRELLASLRPT